MTSRLFDPVVAAGEFRDWQQRFAGIEGFLTDLEGFALLQLAAHGPGCGAIVEIGSYLGRSTAYLAAGTAATGRESVVAVDHFTGSPEHQPGEVYESEELKRQGSTLPRFRANLEAVGLLGRVDVRVGASIEVAGEWSGPIRLLFVDGDHSYEASRADFEAWSPFVVPKGLVGFHDVPNWSGVTRFYEELVARGGEFREVASIDSLKVLQRVTAPAS